RVLDRSGGHLLETHRAPLVEDGECRMERTRNDGGVEPSAGQILPTCGVPIDRRAFGRPTLSDPRNGLSGTLRIPEDQRFTTKTVEILFDHATHEECGHSGVECVATLREHLHSSGGGERVSGG